MGGLYNMLFGVNPAAGVLCAILGKRPKDFGRFRDAYVTLADGEPLIAIYTRDGGGNRLHFVYDEHSSYDRDKRRGELTCRWDGCEWNPRDPACDQAHDPVPSEGPECDCTGCTITYAIPAMDGYVRDSDDGYDSTYCTAFFRAPDDDWHELLFGLAREGTPDDDWRELIAALNDPPAEASTRPQRLAAQLVEHLEKPK